MRGGVVYDKAKFSGVPFYKDENMLSKNFNSSK